MIAKLRGLVDTVGEDFCIIDVNGVGYLVFASSKTLGKVAPFIFDSKSDKYIIISLNLSLVVIYDIDYHILYFLQ